jgi:hypothetical protein
MMVFKNLFGIVDVQIVLHTFVLLYVFGIVDVNIFLYILYLVKVDEVGLWQKLIYTTFDIEGESEVVGWMQIAKGVTLFSLMCSFKILQAFMFIGIK